MAGLALQSAADTVVAQALPQQLIGVWPLVAASCTRVARCFAATCMHALQARLQSEATRQNWHSMGSLVECGRHIPAAFALLFFLLVCASSRLLIREASQQVLVVVAMYPIPGWHADVAWHRVTVLSLSVRQQ